MSAAALEITSELPCDLLQEHLHTIIALLERPLPRNEVLARLGSEAVLHRLLKYGVVTADGLMLKAVAHRISQLRRAGMVVFLERDVLSSLSPSAERKGTGTLSTRFLRLPPQAIEGLRRNLVMPLFDDLLDISERRRGGDLHPLSILVAGTSQLERGALGQSQQALAHVKAAWRERSGQAEPHRAVLSQFDCLIDVHGYRAASHALDVFLTGLHAMQTTSPHEATYHLTLATHWHGRSDDPSHPPRWVFPC